MIKLSKFFNFKILFWLLFYLLVFSLLWHHSFSFLDPDLGWHLKVGQSIINTHLVPNLNIYNYTFTGHWVDHEWLSNVILYWTYSHWGYVVVNIIFSLIIVLALGLLNWYLFKIRPRINLGLVIILELIGLMASLAHFGVRIQELGVLFLVILLIIIEQYNRRRNWKILLILPPFIYLWSNLHASFLIALFLIAAWIFIKLIERYWFLSSKTFLKQSKKYLNFNYILSKGEIGSLLVVWLTSFALTLLTPYHWRLYRFLAGYRHTYYLNHIQEWLSQFHFPLQYLELLYLVLVILATLLAVYYWRYRQKFRLDLWQIFLLFLFIILAFKSRRNFPLMFVATLGIIVYWWQLILEDINLLSRSKKSNQFNWWLKAFLLLCLILISADQFLVTKTVSDPFQSFCNNYPCRAVKFLKNHPTDNSLRLFNHYAWGGYLIWTEPKRLIFIDGRLPQVEWQGRSFLADYHSFFEKNTNFTNKLNKYNISLILIPHFNHPLRLSKFEKIFFHISNQDLESHNYLRKFLAQSPNWKLVFEDKTAVIYQRKF